MAKITFKGNLGKDAELRTVGEGENKYSVCSMWVAENIKRRDDVKETVWHKVTIWRKYAEVMAQYLKSGRRIEVSGDLKKVKFYTTQDGRVVPYADIWADEIELLDRPQPEGEVPPETEETETEDTPF
jgi:single-strand DNA-binding protein